MKEIDKNSFCIHGKTLDLHQYEEFKHCNCCNQILSYEEKELLGKESKLCSWCLLKPIKEELL